MSHCEGCKKYADCKDGSGLTWPCGAYRSTVTTNADRIRGMSDEELAVFFAKVNAALYRADLPIIGYRGETVNDNLDWLRQPAETEGTE